MSRACPAHQYPIPLVARLYIADESAPTCTRDDLESGENTLCGGDQELGADADVIGFEAIESAQTV